MTRLRRWRWWGKWAAAAGSVLLLATFVASGWWLLTWGWGTSRHTTYVSVRKGALWCSDYGWSGHGIRAISLLSLPHAPNWGEALHFEWELDALDRHVATPLCIPIGISAGVTGFLFWRDRSRRPNSCPRCRYDLSATPPSAPCPECGWNRPAATTSNSPRPL